MGNRVAKNVLSSSGSWIETEFYVRDAQGNVMAIYKKDIRNDQMNFNLTEQHIYGSARLGVDRRNVDMIAASTPIDNVTLAVKRGEKHYELSNHLGNVLATVSDKKIAVMSGANLSYYRADVVSYSDYYPFGAPMTERTAVVTPTDVRYGFNGKEMDNEINGNGNAYDFGARTYDARLGRWWSVDPLFAEYMNLSVYCFTANNPIYYIDSDGRRFKVKGSDDKASDGPNKGMSNFNIAVQDVYSLLPSTDGGAYFKSILDISTSGEVTLKIALSRDEVVALNDPGIILLYDLITSHNDYAYEVNITATSKTRSGEVEYENLDEPFNMSNDPNAKPQNNQISNVSVTRKLAVLSENPTNRDKDFFNSVVPAEDGIEGHVTIAPVTRFVFNMGMPGQKSRASIVFHELLENYFRTEKGLGYDSDANGKKNGAHDSARIIEEGLPSSDHRRSKTPGKGDVTNKNE
jgi:RHS repeat-associated protein